MIYLFYFFLHVLERKKPIFCTHFLCYGLGMSFILNWLARKNKINESTVIYEKMCNNSHFDEQKLVLTIRYETYR